MIGTLIRVGMILAFRAWRIMNPRAWKFDFLEIKLNGEIPEELPHTNWIRRFTRVRTAFRDYLFILREARDDPNLKFVVFHIQRPDLGWGQVWELREVIRELRDAGLVTIAFLESADNRSYYLAAACDEIFMVPTGQVSLRGLATEVLFFKGLLEKIKVKAELMHEGKYKSASELFTRKTMSPAHREEINDILDRLFAILVDDIANDRRLTVKALEKLIDKGNFLGREAKENGMVDRLCYEDEIMEVLEERLGRRPRRAGMARYESARALDLPLKFHLQSRPRIALLYATGPISLGQSSDYAPSGPSTGAESITRALREIRENRSIVGTVVRVMSPGGSALASDLIWREVAMHNPHTDGSDNPGQNDKPKPVIVSMGDIAASGGYYISCPADKILASPTTITGSIGVVTGKFNLSGLYDALGLGIETITRGKAANRDTSSRGYSPKERSHVKQEMAAIYSDFIEKVGIGRKMKTPKVKKLAQGRVWLGSQAVENGLVDSIGGLMPALDELKQQVGIAKDERVIVEIYPRKKRFVKLPRPGSSHEWVKQFAARRLLSLLPGDIRAIIPLLNSDEPLALMPYRLKIY